MLIFFQELCLLLFLWLLKLVDGLCGSVTFVTMLAFSAICGIMDSYEISIYAVAIAGGCLGFLIWNLHPAKCFMGDTGSMYLGGSFVAIGLLKS